MTSAPAAFKASARSRLPCAVPTAAPTSKRRARPWMPEERLPLLDVLDRDQSLKPAVPIHDGKLLDPMFLKDLFCFLHGGPHGRRDEILLGHDLVDGLVEIRFEPEITVGEDSDEFFAFDDRDPGNVVLMHHLEGIPQTSVRGQGKRSGDHSAFRPFDLVHLGRLLLDGHVFCGECRCRPPGPWRSPDGIP